MTKLNYNEKLINEISHSSSMAANRCDPVRAVTSQELVSLCDDWLTMNARLDVVMDKLDRIGWLLRQSNG